MISALVICKNEEKTIARCLKSLAWCDEILVIDAESEDRTPEICQDSSAPWASKIRFVSRPWRGFKDQRSFSLESARFDWVLVLDADEECSVELAEKIRELLAQPGGPPRRAYKIRRVEYFLGKPIHHGIWNPSYQDRFFYRRGVQYANEIHEYPVFPEAPLSLHEPIHHDPAFEPEKFLYKMNKYTSIEARDRVQRGMRTNWFRIFFAFPAMFFKNYFYYGAYKDGMHGFVISALEGISRTVRHIKVWQATREIGS